MMIAQPLHFLTFFSFLTLFAYSIKLGNAILAKHRKGAGRNTLYTSKIIIIECTGEPNKENRVGAH